MTPEQRTRSQALKTRNLRRLSREAVEQEFRQAGLNALCVADERFEHLLVRFKASRPVEELELHEDWQGAVRDFTAPRFGVSVARLWDWDGAEPMWRVAAALLQQRPDCLARIYSSGFWLVDDDDNQVLVVDLESDEDDQRVIANTKEMALADA